MAAKIKGWVYVITNDAMPGLVKIGYSTKDPALRADELANTGSPHPYKVVYDTLVIEPRDIEQTVHEHMKSVREGREWFRCTPHEAVRAVRTIAKSAMLMESSFEDPEESGNPVYKCPKCGASNEKFRLHSLRCWACATHLADA